GAKMLADARALGNGGRVIVWADNDTHFSGDLSARGGERGGDGGFGETSGKNVLYFKGTADLSARRGRRGNLLLDPANITVANPPPAPDKNGDGTSGDDVSGNIAATDDPGKNSRI